MCGVCVCFISVCCDCVFVWGRYFNVSRKTIDLKVKSAKCVSPNMK